MRALAILSVSLTALLSPQASPEIQIEPGDWGAGGKDDIRAVLVSTASVLVCHAPARKWSPILVRYRKQGPITLFEPGPKGETRIGLSARDSFWSQYAFQFAHEIGHLLCGMAEYPNPNQWFEETLCETASLFALRRMASSWVEKPPYPNWAAYAPRLGEYADARLKEHRFPGDVTLADWYREREEKLRKNPEMRAENTQMAGLLLPFFEKDPSRWEAAGHLNDVRTPRDRGFRGYLQDWKRSSPEKHRAFISDVALKFGVALE